MTFPRLIVTTMWIASGVTLGFLFENKWGPMPRFFGFLTGILGTFLFTWLIILTSNLLLKSFPECRNQKCLNFRDYTWRHGTLYGREHRGAFCYRCKCGDVYIRDGKRFLQILNGHELRPFKKYQNG